MSTIALRTVDLIETMVLVDNCTDILQMQQTEVMKRPMGTTYSFQGS